jgi:hypothetical protein
MWDVEWHHGPKGGEAMPIEHADRQLGAGQDLQYRTPLEVVAPDVCPGQL